MDCSGLVIVPPITLPAFANTMSAREIEVCCVNASVEYVKTQRIQFLQRIVCLEAKENQSSSSFLAETLFQLVKSDFDQMAAVRDHADESSARLPRPCITVCHDSKVLARMKQHTSMMKKDLPQANSQARKGHKKTSKATSVVSFSAEVSDPGRRGTHAVLLRGTPSCMHAALLLILDHIAPQRRHLHR